MPGLGGAGEGGFHDPMDASVSEETGKVYTAGGSSQVCGLEPPVLMAPTMVTIRLETTKLSEQLPVVGGPIYPVHKPRKKTKFNTGIKLIEVWYFLLISKFVFQVLLWW